MLYNPWVNFTDSAVYLLTGQFTDKPTRDQSSRDWSTRGLVYSLTANFKK